MGIAGLVIGGGRDQARHRPRPRPYTTGQGTARHRPPARRRSASSGSLTAPAGTRSAPGRCAPVLPDQGHPAQVQPVEHQRGGLAPSRIPRLDLPS
jgi:hypothetical protein